MIYNAGGGNRHRIIRIILYCLQKIDLRDAGRRRGVGGGEDGAGKWGAKSFRAVLPLTTTTDERLRYYVAVKTFITISR